jgi:hypothetical protein
MEERRFDELTRVLGAAVTRRQVLKGVLGVAVGAMLGSIGLRSSHSALAAAPLCDGVPYDPNSQCCEPAGIQPRYPIADLDLCPDRVPHPGHVPGFNGCGPAQGFIRHVIPNKIGPFRNIDFTPACNNHDICYDTCNNVKSTCDRNFLNDMRAACAQAYPGNGYIDRYMRAGCSADAYIYYTAVSQTPTGAEAYASAQRGACDCCAICDDCGGSGDERCCQGVCHDACPEGQQRNPDTCECDPCLGQDDGTSCGTSAVCCHESCVSDQCPSGKTFSYDSCNCICEPRDCADGQHQDPDTCECVAACTETSCPACQTCDAGSGLCVNVDDNTECGGGNVCCEGVCQSDCTCNLPCSNGDCCPNTEDWACCEDGCCPQVTLGTGTSGAYCVAPGSQTAPGKGAITVGGCCQPNQLMKLSAIDPASQQCVCDLPDNGYDVFCDGNMPTDYFGATPCSCGAWNS